MIAWGKSTVRVWCSSGVIAATERLQLWYPFARRCALMAKYFICRWRRDWEERHRMLFGVIGQMNAAVVFSTTIR